MIKKVLASVVALLFVALLGYRVAAARNDTQTRAEDRAQIEKLMWNYDRALGAMNADAYVALYTPDGQFGTGANAVKGRDALKKMLKGLSNARTRLSRKDRSGCPCTS
jgi:SnoaL-like domain